MTDSQFLTALRKAHKLAVQHKAALRVVEQEYERRVGGLPCDIDDDSFIDLFDYGQGRIEDVTVESVIENGKFVMNGCRN